MNFEPTGRFSYACAWKMASSSADQSTSYQTTDQSESAVDADNSDSSSTPSILSTLCQPTPADLARKRRILQNPSPVGKRRARGHGAFDPISVTPTQRVKNFPNESLTVSNKKLFCKACREEVGLKSSVVHNHVKSSKHKLGKERLAKKEATERDIAHVFKSVETEQHLRGETLPEDQRVYRVRVVRTFLRTATPLNKLPQFRGLLEENALRLTDKRQMADIVPFIFTQEQDILRKEISEMHLSVIFDGTTRFGEAMAIVVRYVDNDWCVQQRLIRLKLLQKSMKGEEIAQVVMDTLSREYGILHDRVLSCMRDRAAVNNVAVKFIQVLYTRMLDIGCFSHTLNLVGDKICIPTLSDFILSWLSLFSHSTKAKLLWKEKTGRPIRSYCPTRWWSKWECMKQVFELFPDVVSFIESNEEFSSTTRTKLMALLNDTAKKALLKVELAIVVDFGHQFVTTTYNMEGDGPLAFVCYESISALTAAVNIRNYPNLTSVCKDISSGNQTTEQSLIAYGQACVDPAIHYYKQRLNDSMKVPLQAFKAARLFVPSKVQEMNVNTQSVDSLAVFPFFDPLQLQHLKAELPNYIAACEDIDPSQDTLTFWRNHKSSLPNWSAAASKVAVLQPSSAAAERVFSLLKQSFSEAQNATLQDIIETSVMLQYNNRDT